MFTFFAGLATGVVLTRFWDGLSAYWNRKANEIDKSLKGTR